ncbi:unnamed protein product [Orchesella dallaii]|uniref:F-box domain-containing protein n=1 Tax=Orchesella dallaii TaxID=48710 RepID=A0ABP1QBZ1_9HEXA
MECSNVQKSGAPLRSPTTTPVLPPETWKHIFQFLGPGDLYSVTKACPEWNELLEDKRNTFLLPLVIPSLMKYVDRNTTLKFRMIATSTKNAVDKTLQGFYDSDGEHPSNINYEGTSSQKHLCKVADGISNCYSFHYKDVGEFLKKVLPDMSLVCSDTNPFLMRHIACIMGFPSNIAVRRTAHIHSILSKFGHHLSSLRINIIADASNQQFKSIVSHLHLVPNLKRLLIKDWFLSLVLNTDFPQPLEDYDFPVLSKLVRVVIDFVIDDASMSTFVLSLIRQYSTQLSSLACHGTLLALPDLNVDVLNRMFSNIKKFHLVVEDPNVVTAFQKLCNVSWCLERLKLEVRFSDEINGQLVLSTINNFYKSLEYLELDCNILPNKLNVNEGNDSEEETYRQMSNLKTLITNSKNMELDFFREFLQKNCQHLKQLHFKTANVQSTEEGRWALEHIRNLEKVVFWKAVGLPSGRPPLQCKYTMHRIRD